MNRDEIGVGKTYIGEKEDVRRILGIDQSFAPLAHTTDKQWVAYELITEPPKYKEKPKGVSKDGFPIYYCSLTAFRLWAKEEADFKLVYIQHSEKLH